MYLLGDAAIRRGVCVCVCVCVCVGGWVAMHHKLYWTCYIVMDSKININL